MEDAPSFFKFIILPSRDLQKLSIPTEFTKENGSSFLDHAYLRAPGGSEHKVDLKKRGDKPGHKVWFSNGWKEFAENYSISFGHFLVFYYQGNSCFNVLIYDKSSCEIDYHSFDTQSSVEDEDESSAEDEDEDDDSEEQCMDIVNLEKGKVVMSQAYMKAEAFQCDNPNFIVAMNMSYVEKDSRMWIPVLHAQRYLKEANEAVLQGKTNPKGRDLIVNITRGTGCVRFGTGWSGFVTANRLEVDDVCKFELINRRTHTYRVHIFHRKH